MFLLVFMYFLNQQVTHALIKLKNLTKHNNLTTITFHLMQFNGLIILLIFQIVTFSGLFVINVQICSGIIKQILFLQLKEDPISIFASEGAITLYQSVLFFGFFLKFYLQTTPF